MSPSLKIKRFFMLYCVFGALLSNCTIATFIPAIQTPNPETGLTVTPWRPSQDDTWQIQFSGDLDTSIDADIYVVDGFEITPEQTAYLHTSGHQVVCYLNAGAWEDWRPDASSYPAEIIGEAMDGWPGEFWLDIRRLDLLMPIIDTRLNTFRLKGCDGIDPDNINGYAQFTGFALSYEDQIRFNQLLAEATHAHGMSIGLKNDLEQIEDLLHNFDWASNEQCFEFEECHNLFPFIAAGKPVLNIEYNLNAEFLCPKAKQVGFYSQIKHLELDAWRIICR